MITYKELLSVAEGKSIFRADQAMVKLLRVKGWDGRCDNNSLFDFLNERGDEEMRKQSVNTALYLLGQIAALQAVLA